MSKKTSLKKLLITRFPLESAWGGEEKIHILLADEFLKLGIMTELWSSCRQFLSAFRQKGYFFGRAFFVPDPTSKVSFCLVPITAPLLFLQGIFFLPFFRLRGCQSILMLTFFEKCLLTPLALLLGYRVVWAHHAPLEKWFFQNPLLFLWKLWSRRVNIIVPSRALKNQIDEITLGLNIFIIPNATALLPNEILEIPKKFLRFIHNKQKVIIGTATRLAPEKNLMDFLELAKAFSQHTFLIAGEGPEKEKLETYISEKALKNIFLLGYLEKEDLASFYSLLDIFCACSRYETFGLSLAEAAQFGVPAVAPCVGGILDIVINGETGFLYAPGSMKDATQKLEFLIKNKKEREEMGKRAKILSKRFVTEKYRNGMKKALFGE